MTADSQGTQGVKGLATPVMVRLMENAAVKAVAPDIAADLTTVGTRLDITHLAPTPVGMRVEARATLLEVEGRVLVFAVSAEDEAGIIGKGTHQRVIVRRQGFAERTEARWTEAQTRASEKPAG
jgi:predicted thioesterase